MEKNMFYIADTPKKFTQAVTDLEEAVTDHGFSVLHTHDIGETLRNKGQTFTENCKILEVCNPQHAAAVLGSDMKLNMALPCRISVFTENGITKIGLIEPVKMMTGLSEDPKLAEIALQVQQQTIAMIEQAK
jgi:uncharacterized protein (DUF302 family)